MVDFPNNKESDFGQSLFPCDETYIHFDSTFLFSSWYRLSHFLKPLCNVCRYNSLPLCRMSNSRSSSHLQIGSSWWISFCEEKDWKMQLTGIFPFLFDMCARVLKSLWFSTKSSEMERKLNVFFFFPSFWAM